MQFRNKLCLIQLARHIEKLQRYTNGTLGGPLRCILRGTILNAVGIQVCNMQLLLAHCL